MGSRILLVEDETNIADYLVTGLREEGYTVEHAADGDSGRRRLESQSWDLVLLDWWLPGEDGLALLRGLRERDRRTPVMILTARDQVRYRQIATVPELERCPISSRRAIAPAVALCRTRRTMRFDPANGIRRSRPLHDEELVQVDQTGGRRHAHRVRGQRHAAARRLGSRPPRSRREAHHRKQALRRPARRRSRY